MKKTLITFTILILSVFLAAISVYYERTNPTIVGNVCPVSTDNPKGLCYEDLPSGGFPFSYLYDAGGISGMGSLNYVEDNFYLPWFLADIAFYFSIITPTLFLIKKRIFIPSPNKV